MNENHYDELDKFFQSRLDIENAYDKDWSRPPDAIFGKAIDTINIQKERRRKKYFLWVFCGLAFIFIFSIAVKSGLDKIDDANQVIGDQSGISNVAAEDINNKLEVEENSLDKSSLDQHSEIFKVNNARKNVVTERNQSNELNNKSLIPKAHVRDNETLQQKYTEDKNIPHAGYETINEKLNLSSEPVIISENILPSIALLPIGYIYSNEEDILPPILSSEPIVELAPKKNLSISLYAGFNFSSFSMSNIQNSEYSLTEYERWYSGYNIGIRLGHQLSKRWQMETKIGISSINNHSLFSEKILYDKGNEYVNANGQTIFESALVVESPTIATTNTSSFALKGEKIEQNDILDHKTDIQQEFSLLDIALGLRLNLLQKGRVSMGIGSGMKLHKVMNVQQDMINELYYEDKMMLQEDISIQSLDGINNTLFSFYSDLDFQLNLNEHLSVTADFGYGRSFSSIRRVRLDTDAHTYLNILNTSLGIKYRF